MPAERPEYEKFPTLPISPEVQAQLDQADKFLEDLEAGRVERGVDALAIGLAHARHFAPGELVGSCCGDDET
jgi:hypothetical protein